MGFVAKLLGKKTKGIISDVELIDAHVCPNCWGKMEYDDQYIQFEKDQTKSNVNHNKEHQKAFIQQFVETNVTGIRLKREGDKIVCQKCNTRY